MALSFAGELTAESCLSAVVLDDGTADRFVAMYEPDAEMAFGHDDGYC
jgi:hypothetical protein